MSTANDNISKESTPLNNKIGRNIQSDAKPSTNARSSPWMLFAVAAALLSAMVPILTSFRYPSSQSSFSARHLPRLSAGKTFVVTGATNGLGLEVVRHLVAARKAHTVIMGCRSHIKCQRLQSEIQFFRDVAPSGPQTRVVCIQLDLKKLDSIRTFASMVNKTLSPVGGKLHYLINNAGAMAPSGPYLEWDDETGAEMHMLVNHLGHFYLTSLLMNNLKQTTSDNEGATAAANSPGTVVSVSSLGGSFPFLDADDIKLESLKLDQLPWYVKCCCPSFIKALWAYGASKRANLYFAYELHKRYGPQNSSNDDSSTIVRSVAAHPGISNTGLFVSLTSNRAEGGETWFPDFMSKYLEYALEFVFPSPEEASMTTLKAALDPTLPSSAYVGPAWFAFGKPKYVGKVHRSPHHFFSPIPVDKKIGISKNETVTDVFWRKSEEALGIRF